MKAKVRRPLLVAASSILLVLVVAWVADAQQPDPRAGTTPRGTSTSGARTPSPATRPPATLPGARGATPLGGAAAGRAPAGKPGSASGSGGQGAGRSEPSPKADNARGPAAEPTSSPTVEDALRYTPLQADVDYARPKPDEAPRCKISAQKVNGHSSWVVEDGQGQVLRRFIDTNGDGRVDQWCYFKDGLEVYRDVDSNFNTKADQYRWFNTGGSRWGIDRDEDGTIDVWAMISAEEVTAEVVAALAKQEPERFDRLLLTATELRTLGLGEAKTRELAEKLPGLSKSFGDVLRKQKVVTANTKWTHFSAGQPGVVPTGTDGSSKDLQVYENVMAVVQTGNEHGQVQIGTLVKVGDVWRAIHAPQPIGEGQQELAGTGFFFRAGPASRPSAAGGAASAPSEKAQEILSQMEKLDAAISRATTPAEQTALHGKRADLIEQMAGEATEPKDRTAWLRQLADTVAAAVQAGTYPEGVKRLESLFARLAASPSDKPVAAYVRFRQLSAEYGLSLQVKGADFAKIQTDWLKKLEQYVDDYPQSPDAAEAMLQLAIAQEFAGREEDARKWYGRIVQGFAELPIARKAAGAQARLDSVGKVLPFQGKTTTGETVDLARFRGQVVLIHYWATWCEPCKVDMAVIKDLLDKYGPAGFSAIGVNLDNDAPTANSFLSEHRVAWPQVFEEGGLDSRPAVELGVLTLPTMILIDPDGKVRNRNISTSELTNELKKAAR